MSDVWKKLSLIDCSKHVEKKGQLTYLSWTWAWSILMENYPSSSYTFHDETFLADGSVMVSCTVTVEGQSHTMWLPVMDNRNNAITNPDTRKISDARMRCLVKAIAMHGLGIYIYAGEDLPEAAANASITDDDFATINKLLDDTSSDKEAFCKAFGIKSVKDLPISQLAKATGMLQTKLRKLENDNA